MMPEINKIHIGDCLEVMRSWPDAFVQTVVTSPPYWGLRDYGVTGQIGLEKIPGLYVERMVEVFREVRRVLRDDGTLWLNLGDSYAANRGYQVPQKLRGGPAAAEAGAAGGRSANAKSIGLKVKDLVGIPWLVAFALQADGWYLRSDIIWSKPNPMPESVTDRPTKAHEYLFLLSKSERYFYDADAIKERATWPNGANSPESIKSPYGQGFTRANKTPVGCDTRKGSHRELLGRYKPLPEGQANIREKRDKQRGHGRRHAGFNDRWDEMERKEQCGGMRNKRSVWTVSTAPFPEAHFATFPPALIKPCILAGSRRGDIVFDPFMGAGTTGLVAAMYDRQFIGTELNPEYIAIAERRIATEKAQLKFI